MDICMKSKQCLGICSLLVFITITQGMCPFPCSCSYYKGQHTTDCRNKGLKVVPKDKFDSTTKIVKLDYNRLVTLPEGIFDHLRYLNTLWLRFNQLTSIPAGIFDNNTKLTTLSLHFNRLTSIPAGLFDNNKLLTHLYLSSNQLTTLPPGIFDNNHQLNGLYLYYNQLSTLPAGIFDNNKQLREIYLPFNQLSTLPAGIFDNNKLLLKIYLYNNQLSTLPAGIFDNNKQLLEIHFNYNKIRTLSSGIFDHNEQLRKIQMGHNQLTALPTGIFDNNKNITYIFLSKNPIGSLSPGIFRNNKELSKLGADVTRLTHLAFDIFHNNKELKELSLTYNRISQLHRDTFKHLTDLRNLFLQGNKLTNLPQGVFRNNLKITVMSLEKNLLENVPGDLLQGLTRLYTFALGRNKLQRLPNGFFKDNKNLEALILGMNNLSSVDLRELRKLRQLSVNQNSITSSTLTRKVLNNLTRLSSLWASYNKIEDISDNSFLRSPYLSYILLNNNNLWRITNQTFKGAIKLEILFLSDNPIEFVADCAFLFNPNLKTLFLLQTKIKTINMQWYHPSAYSIDAVIQIYPTENPYRLQLVKDAAVHQTFSTSGFTCKPDGKNIHCTPCLSGSYIDFKVLNNQLLCVNCPAGGFYEDSMAYYGHRAYGNGCKMCDNGTFVHVNNAPGRRKEDCKPCPEGTKNRVFALFRACPCEDGFYRLHRFDKCYSCPDSGVACFNESMTLKPGYYWQWISQEEKGSYITFINNLQIFDDSYDRSLVTFNGSFPKHYQCPRSLSCLGGMEAKCAEGYTGPLCAVCDKRHYKLVATCFKCPTLVWLVFQIAAIILVVMVILFVAIKGRKHMKQDKRSFSDVILARLKIIVSFYQIFSSTLDGFSYVQWPSAMTTISEYAKFVQLNIIQIAPLHCFNSRLKMDAYGHLVTTCSLTATVILVAVMYYHLKSVYLRSRAKRGQSDIRSTLESTKEACYRNVFLFLFVTYPQTCSTIFQMLPPACHRICQDSSQTQCTFYLKADYSITCFTEKYNRYVILAYAALIYPFAVPLLTLAVLWKYYYKSTSDESITDKEKDKSSCKQPINRRNMREGKYNGADQEEPQSMTSNRNECSAKAPTKQWQSMTFQNILPFGKRENGNSSSSNTMPAGIHLSSNDVMAKSAKQSHIAKALHAFSAVKRVSRRARPERNPFTSIPLIAGLSFIFENYSENCWFWETLEMTRKLLLTSSVALIGAEGRTALGVASIFSGCYAILHAHFKPIPDKFEHILQLTSLLVTLANTCIGMMLKIDQGALLDADAKIMDSLIMTVLLVAANVMVTALVVVKYLMAFVRSIYSIIQNPRCSLACCLSVMLTLDEVQSEARSMESSRGWEMKTQLQRGNEFEGLSMKDVAEDFGLTGVDVDDDKSDGDDDKDCQQENQKKKSFKTSEY